MLGVPYDASSSFLRGSAGAPALIRHTLHSEATNGWTESMVDLRAPGTLADAGDVALPDAAARMAALIATGTRPIALGGDHSITYPLVRGVRPAYPRLALLLFDAHPDLYDALDGDRLSHGSPFARIMEDGLVDRLVQVGIRTLNAHQRAQAERFGVEVVTMREWRDGRVLSFDDPLYISVDLDVLDPAFAPGVSHREPGGLSTRQLIDAIQSVQARVVAADVVEFNPSVDPLGTTAWVAAKIVRELAARLLESP